MRYIDGSQDKIPISQQLLLHDSQSVVQAEVEKYRGSPALEAQARACEYASLFRHAGLRGGLLEHMPPLDAAAAARATASVDPAAAAALSMDLAGGDLLSLDEEEPAPVVPGNQSATDMLADLLGDGLGHETSKTVAAMPGIAVGGTNTADLLDLLGGGANGTATPAPAVRTPLHS